MLIAFAAASFMATDGAYAYDTQVRLPTPASGGDLPGGMTQEQIAQELNNPVGNLWMLISQGSVEQLTAGHLSNTTVSDIAVEPVLPLHLNENWNLITRPYVPVIIDSPDVWTNSVSGRLQLGRKTGIGDMGVAALLSPSEPTPFGRQSHNGRLVWGVGSTLQFPTASENTFGHHKYQAGPTGAIAYLDDKITALALAQQWWSYAGDARYPATSYTWLQYTLAYEFTPSWQITSGTPIVQFNWKQSGHNAVTLPIGIGISKLFFLGPLPVKVAVEYEKAVVHPDRTPYGDNIFRLTVVPVLPALISGSVF